MRNSAGRASLPAAAVTLISKRGGLLLKHALWWHSGTVISSRTNASCVKVS